jgi:hypothetical protein
VEAHPDPEEPQTTRNRTTTHDDAVAGTSPTHRTDRHGHRIEDRGQPRDLAREVRDQLSRRRALGLLGSLDAADLVRLSPPAPAAATAAGLAQQLKRRLAS